VSGTRDRDFDPTGDPLLSVLSEAARLTAIDEAGPGPTPVVWHRLQAERARPVRRRPARLVFVAAGLAAAAGLLVTVQLSRRPRPITYAIAPGTVEPSAPAAEQDGYIRGVGPTGTEVRFSDGTRVAVAHGGRLSVLSRASDGARLRVEDGEAHFEVVHKPRAAWTVEAGPFVVYVTGTSFDVRWSGADETVEVRLRSGSVRVGGPFIAERVTLRPGQRLTARR
jgi:ferric-dicitrate binding protein FerR (iron transport regulator)